MREDVSRHERKMRNISYLGMNYIYTNYSQHGLLLTESNM